MAICGCILRMWCDTSIAHPFLTLKAHQMHAPQQKRVPVLPRDNEILRYAQELLIPFLPRTLEHLHASREIDGGILLPSGTHIPLGSLSQPFLSSPRLGEVSVRDFLMAYATVHNRAIGDAKNLIAEHTTTASLIRLRAHYYSQGPSALLLPLTPPTTHLDFDLLSHERICLAALDAHSLQQAIYSVDMALLAVSAAERREELRLKHAACNSVINDHAADMREARAAAFAHADPREAFQRVFERLYELKCKRFGVRPTLVTVHDVDKTISPVESYNREKPGHSVDRLFYRIVDRVQPGIPGPQRCPLAHHLLGDPSYGDLAKQAYRKTGESIRQFMYHYMVRGVREAQELGVEVHLLTGNLHPITDGVTSILGITPKSALGVWHNDRRASLKPFELYSLLLKNPNSIIVMVDDSDGSLIRGLQRSSILDSEDVQMGLQDSVLFIARGPDSLSGQTHALAEYLSAARIPHGINYHDESEPTPTGYQGFNQLLGAYVALTERS